MTRGRQRQGRRTAVQRAVRPSGDHQAASGRKLPDMVDRGNAVASGQCHKLISSGIKEWIILHDQAADTLFRHYREVLIEIRFAARM